MHPPSSGETDEAYRGTWVMDGYEYEEGKGYHNLKEGQDPWTLELNADNTFTMKNNSQSLQGIWAAEQDDIEFTSDTLYFGLDPPGISDGDFELANLWDGLRDILLGYVFVRPGKTATIPFYEYEGAVKAPPETHIGAWRLESGTFVPYGYAMTMTAEQILADSGEKEVIITFENGYLNSISSETWWKIPTVPYTYTDNAYYYYDKKTRLTHVFYFMGNDTMYWRAFPMPEEVDGTFVLKRITSYPQ